MAYDWPGNVRELENCIERAMALGTGPFLQVADLPTTIQYEAPERPPENDAVIPLEEMERRAILRALREAGGDNLVTARVLGIGKTTLYRSSSSTRGRNSKSSLPVALHPPGSGSFRKATAFGVRPRFSSPASVILHVTATKGVEARNLHFSSSLSSIREQWLMHGLLHDSRPLRRLR
jgi:hypothetical protein